MTTNIVKETIAIVGGGQLTIPCMVEALARGNRIFIYTNRPGKLAEEVGNIHALKESIYFIPTTYQQGSDPKYWESAFSSLSRETPFLRVVNMRGVSTLPEDATYADVVFRPAQAVVTGLRKAISSSQVALINCSSSTASVEGFAEKNQYAYWRKVTDHALSTQAEFPGYNLRFDLVENNRASRTMNNPNHGAGIREFTHGYFQFLIGKKGIISIQPVSEKQAALAILNPEVYQQNRFATIDAVGPKAYSQEEAYQVYSNIFHQKLRVIQLPFPVGKWVAKHVPVAQLSYGVSLLEHRAENPRTNHPLGHEKFQTLVSEPLLNLEEMYSSCKGPIVGVQSPLRMIVHNTVKALARSSNARRDFIEDVAPHLPSMALQAAQHLVKEN